MTQMNTITLHLNQLTGTLPSEWSGMAQLFKLILYSNQLTGTLPSEWSSLTQSNLFFLFFV